MIRKSIAVCLVSLAAFAVTSPAARAQQNETVKRTVLQKSEFPDKMTTVMVQIDIAPNATVPRHTHPGVEVIYVAEGAMDLAHDGQPVQHLKAGESGINPPGVIHSVTAGPRGVKLVSTYVVEKDTPMATPAP
jgi:quercetin dioxygenase-like cupin family protein